MPWEPRGRAATIERLLRLYLRLDGIRTRPDLHALAAEFGVHQRTIRRDLEVLEFVSFRLRHVSSAVQRARHDALEQDA